MIKKQKPTTVNFEDLDLFSFNLIVQEWNLEFIQLRPGRFSSCISQFICEDFQLGYARFNIAVKQEGLSPEGIWTFAFVNEVDMYWRNYKVNPRSVIIYAPGSKINAVSEAHFEVMTFSITERYLQLISIKLGIAEVLDKIKSVDVLETQSAIWDELRIQIFKRIHSKTDEEDLRNKTYFLGNFLTGLLNLIKSAKASVNKVSSMKRLKLLTSVEKSILSNIGDHYSVKKIAEDFKVSERTLLYAFKNRFKLGPKAYMKILSLNDVYHKLMGSSEVDSITATALESGFWHMGQFYKDYKKFFGELPSETMNRPTPQIPLP